MDQLRDGILADRHKHDRMKPESLLLQRGVAILSACLAFLTVAGAWAATPYRDVQRIGLQPLYEALVAVANCPDVTINTPRFRYVASQYHLRPDDLTPFGQFGPEIADLARMYEIRVHDDRGAFCSSVRLSFAVVRGILKPTGLPALR